jgi:hypothetical protein
MKNMTPSGYQGFPSLFNGLFGGAAMLLRKLFRRSAEESTAERDRAREEPALRPISGPSNDDGARSSKRR